MRYPIHRLGLELDLARVGVAFIGSFRMFAADSGPALALALTPVLTLAPFECTLGLVSGLRNRPG
jgi:hypothetical protein